MVRVHQDPPRICGGLAQLGEHLLCKQGVNGSIPLVSTKEIVDSVKCSGNGIFKRDEKSSGSLKIWKKK